MGITMGITSSLQCPKSDFHELFENHYHLLSKQNDQLFGPVDLYSKNSAPNIKCILIKKISLSHQTEMKILYNQLKKRMFQPFCNLIDVLHVDQIQQKNYFCGPDIHQAQLYIDYLTLKPLKSELLKRCSQQRYLTEQQIWKITISLFKALKYLHQSKLFHGQIRLQNLLIDQEYHLRLVQKIFIDQSNWTMDLLKSGQHTLIKQQSILYSPTAMQCLHIKQPQVLSFDPFKADVFAIGMIVLSCCSLTQPNTYYNYETFELDMKNIVIVIKEISQKYHSPLLDEVLGMMLTEKDQDRKSAIQVYQKIAIKKKVEMVRQSKISLNKSFRNGPYLSMLFDENDGPH